MYKIQLSNDIKLEIFNDIRKGFASQFFLGFILFFASAIFLTPIVALLIMMARGNGIPFGFILTIVISVLISNYLLKLYLWNKYGKEVFIIQRDKLISYNDYKLFKNNYEEVPYISLSVCIDYNDILIDVSGMLDDAKFETTDSIICFNIDGKTIKSEGKIPIEEIIKIGKYLLK